MRRWVVILLLLCVRGASVHAEPANDASHLRAWLTRQRYPATGLVQSYESIDPALRYQASTYDQALAGMVFLAMGDAKSAQRILDFFNTTWQGQGFANFYHTKSGAVGIETTIHAGPNAWIGLLALAYEARTGQRRYRPLAERIAQWIAGLPHREGGVAMGPRADWGANWTEVYSSENNLSYVALLDGLLEMPGDARRSERLERERRGALRFLQAVAFADVSNRCANSGLNQRGIDTTQSFDIIPMALLIITPARLRALGVDPERLVSCGEQHFAIEHDAIPGFDFTDAPGAFGAKRQRMIAVEWTAMMVRAYRLLAEDHSAPMKAREFLAQATIFQEGLDQLRLQPVPDELCYPYATTSTAQVFPFAPWWQTPAPGPVGLACSVAGTAWRYFAEHGSPLEWH